MPEMGTMQQINSEPLHMGTMHQLNHEPLHIGTILTPQSQAEQYAREAKEAAAEAAQSATDAQTAAASAEHAVAGAVKYSEAQTLTAAQQAQARANIGAGDAEDVADLKSATGDLSDLETQDKSSLVAAINEAAQSGGDTDALAPVIHNTAYGAVASFKDGADDRPIKSLVVGIEPVQDLHGYDSPWPAGGGKNLLDWSKTSVTGTHYGITFTKNEAEGTVTLSGTLTVTSGSIAPIQYSDYSLSGKGYVFLTEHISGDSFVNLNRTYGLRTDTEKAIAVYMTGEAGKTYTETIRISVYASTPTAWTPYSNICPISGFDGLTVTRAGKNLSSVNELADHGPQWGVDQSPIKAMINTLPVGTYTLSNKYEILEMPSSGKVEHGAIYVTAMINGKQQPVNRYTTVLDNSPYLGKVYEEQAVITITEENKGKINHTYTYCDQNPSHTGSGRGKYRVFDIQIELGSTATTYEPYQGETYDITFSSEAGTVYGGTLDAAKGVLVVDRAMVEYDGSSDEPWGVYGDGSDHYCCIIYPSGKAIGWQKSICNEFKNQNNAFGSSSYGIYSDHPNLINTYFRMPNAEVTTRAEFLSWIAEHPIQLCYELATPITYQLTPQEVRTLLGTNNIWADAGPVSVEYTADTKMYIDSQTRATRSLIAGIETDLTASRAYAAGDLLIVGDTLYKAVASIASGATLTPGTNVTPTTVAEQLILLANA